MRKRELQVERDRDNIDYVQARSALLQYIQLMAVRGIRDILS